MASHRFGMTCEDGVRSAILRLLGTSGPSWSPVPMPCPVNAVTTE